MNSRERVNLALNHREPDRVPLDLGASAVTGMQVSSVYLLRQALTLDPPGTPVKVVEPYQMLGEIAPDLLEALGVDVVGLAGRKTLFGFRNEGWKPWTLFDGTPVLVPSGFNTDPEPDGSILMYPEGDRAAPPSGHMPAGGYYFDTIIRQEPIDDARLNPADNLEEFGPISDDDLADLADEADRLYEETDKAIFANFGGTAFGDIALVPGPWMKHPKGIRDVAEWYMSTVIRRDYVWQVFEKQCEYALENVNTLIDLFGDTVQMALITGTDFGTQRGLFISVQAYRDLYRPFHKQINDLIHRRSNWKTFIHSCGSVYQLLPDFIGAGFDILNPVQCSAADMDPVRLKREFGKDLVFWGGGVDTQKTMAFSAPEEVYREVRQRIDFFNQDGGFVFNAIHNIQGNTPVENIEAMFKAIRDSGQ